MDIQPHYVQLDLKFKGPLVSDMQVNTVNDLITLNINYNYLHKLVWVKNTESYYYLIDGNGSLLSHWKKFSQKVTLDIYQSNKEYVLGDIVYLNNKLFQAKGDIPVNTNPSDNLNLWQVIVGDVQSIRLMVNNQSSIIIYTNITNPFFSIVEGTFEFNQGTPVMDSDGLIKVIDGEQTEAQIKRRHDLPNNNGKAYEISFWENNLPFLFTGVINIK